MIKPKRKTNKAAFLRSIIMAYCNGELVWKNSPPKLVGWWMTTYTIKIEKRKDGQNCLYLEYPLFAEDKTRIALLLSKVRSAVFKVESELEQMSEQKVKLEFKKLQKQQSRCYDKLKINKI